MKIVAVIFGCGLGMALVFMVVRFTNHTVAPLFLNSRLERRGEKDLPRLVIERGDTVYCRMKGDDFRFPLPAGSRATNLMVTGGFDTADGSVAPRMRPTPRLPKIVRSVKLPANEPPSPRR